MKKILYILFIISIYCYSGSNGIFDKMAIKGNWLTDAVTGDTIMTFEYFKDSLNNYWIAVRISDTINARIERYNDTVPKTYTYDTIGINDSLRLGNAWFTYDDFGTGTIGGSISTNQIAYGTGANTIGGSSSFLFTGGTKTAGAFYTGTDNPTNTNRFNYDGYFHQTSSYTQSTGGFYIGAIADFDQTGLIFLGTTSPSIRREVASATNPVFIIQNSSTSTGIGGTSSYVSLISSGVEILRASSAGVSIPLLLTVNGDTGIFNNDVHVYGDFRNEPPRSKAGFADSAVTITAGTNVQVTNGYDSLFRYAELSEMTWGGDDTVIISKNGGYNIHFGIRGYATNANDYTAKIAYKRGSTTYYETFDVIQFTTTGATNRNGGFSTAYVELQVGDKVWFVLTRDSGTGDFTIVSGTFNVQTYYLE